MSEGRKLEPREPYSTESKGWIARIVVAVILGEAIWGLLVSVVRGIALPGAAKVIGADSRLFAFIGKPDLDFPALVASILELSVAVIVAVLMNRLSDQHKEKAIKRPAPKSQAISPTPLPAPPTNASSVSTAVAAEPDVPAKTSSDFSPAQQRPQLPKPAKSKKQKAVYYNIVGEPLDTDD
jgi:hypothetical protein